MIIPLFLVVLFVAAGTRTPMFGQNPISSSISEVTVYSDRARVTRSAVTDVAAGSSVLEFIGLPVGLDVGSLEVIGKSSNALTIEGIDLREEFLAASTNPRVQEVEQQLRRLTEQKNALTAQKTVLNEKRLFFSNLSAGLGKMEKGPLSLNEIRQLYAYYGEEISKLSESLLAGERDERRLDLEIDRTQRELKKLQSAANKSQKKVFVNVKVSAATKAEFVIRYVIEGASWTPSYDARFDSTGEKVELRYNAEVHQQTGEDWSNVGMVLSTAQPAKTGRMPELSPLIVDYRSEELPPLPPAPAPTTLALRASKAYAAAAQKDALEKMEISQSKIEQTGLSVSYRVGLKVTIPSDGELHRTSVAVLPLEGKPEYVTTPKLDSGVFLKLHLTNGSDNPLLPGSVSVFREGEFVGTVPMQWVQPGAEFDLYAGRGNAIKVGRKELVNKRSESGMINRKLMEERQYQISAQNFSSTPIKLSISDQLPVSRNVEIVVNQSNFSSQPATTDKDSGKVTWSIDLNPKEKKVIEFGYSVGWPKGKEITSGF